jgi:DNA-binding Lrp family transcriptional regulator
VSGSLSDLLVGGPNVPRQHKYGAKWCEVDGVKFPSRKEARVYKQLKLMEKNGVIKGFKRQVPYKFVHNGVKLCEYRADFVITFLDGRVEVWDAKGFKTDLYKLKKIMMMAFYNIYIVEV